MKIYLDIDGTLISKDFLPASNLHEFTKKALSVGEVFWLTTHCKENNRDRVLEYLARYIPVDTLTLMRQIKPTHWDTLKTEAIDFSDHFLWFDDYLLEVEKNILKKKDVLSSWVKIDLNTWPSIDTHYFD